MLTEPTEADISNHADIQSVSRDNSLGTLTDAPHPPPALGGDIGDGVSTNSSYSVDESDLSALYARIQAYEARQTQLETEIEALKTQVTELEAGRRSDAEQAAKSNGELLKHIELKYTISQCV